MSAMRTTDQNEVLANALVLGLESQMVLTWYFEMCKQHGYSWVALDGVQHFRICKGAVKWDMWVTTKGFKWLRLNSNEGGYGFPSLVASINGSTPVASNWSILDTLDDRAAVNLIAKLLDGTATLPFGKMSDDRCLKMLSKRLLKVALACDTPPVVSTSTTIDMNATAGASLSPTVPGGIDLHKIKDMIGELGAAVPEMPRLVECAYLDGLKDEDGNPAAFLINNAALKNEFRGLTMVTARTPGKTQSLILMTPQFAEMLAAEAAKHSMKIVIEGRKA